MTLLSGAFNDIKTFRNPHDPGLVTGANFAADLAAANVRQAADTWYRMGIIAGKGLNFQRPGNNANDHTDFGTDGGAHNFLRYIERWGAGPQLPRLDPQLLHEPSGHRHLQVLRHRLFASRSWLQLRRGVPDADAAAAADADVPRPEHPDLPPGAPPDAVADISGTTAPPAHRLGGRL